ncbi:MAG: methanogenesis marker 3 protein [Candidatus Methanomethylophilaceae archaeon]
MQVVLNGKEVPIKEGALLEDIMGEDVPYVPGSVVSVLISDEELRQTTDDFEIFTAYGPMTLHLEDNDNAEVFRAAIPELIGRNMRWRTSNVLAFGSVPTSILGDRGEFMYRRYDCFFSLGGFDNSTTYMMIAQTDHRGRYGTDGSRIGRITKGRHLLSRLREADEILDIRPVILETSSQNVIVTSDLKMRLEDGMRIDTYVDVDLDRNAPMGVEHFLVTARRGHIVANEQTSTYMVCSENTDVVLQPENVQVREQYDVTVRSQGKGTGRVFFYKQRRQVSNDHSLVGRVVRGQGIIMNAQTGAIITLRSNPQRALGVGMTQKEAEIMLQSFGIAQDRSGDVSDDAIIVEQEPEWTMTALSEGKVSTIGKPADHIHGISFLREESPLSVHYLEKVSGLDHKPIGSFKVHFTFPDSPMVTFDGDQQRGKSLFPEKDFQTCKVGDLGMTNQVRPYHGLIGIRLQESDEFGPTGEEAYGTNIAGRFEGDLNHMLEGLEEGDLVYVKEVRKDV